MIIFKKTVFLILIILGAAFIVHTLVYLIPGDPAAAIAGEYASADDIRAIREELALDKSFLVRYCYYVAELSTLNMGNSIYTGLPVLNTIIDRFPATFILAFTSMVIAGLFGIALGIISAVYKDTILDNLILSFSSIFISAPIFVTCFILLLIFSYYLNLLPPSGKAGLDPRYIILPALALASRSIALIIRIARNELISVMKEDYIRTARAMGFPDRRIILVFALKNIIVPTLAVILLDFGAYLGGAVVTESVFSWPGIGRLLVDAMYKRDIPVIQGVILSGTILFIFIGFMLDILQNMITRKAE